MGALHPGLANVDEDEPVHHDDHKQLQRVLDHELQLVHLFLWGLFLIIFFSYLDPQEELDLLHNPRK
jgi:hypothetical protein